MILPPHYPFQNFAEFAAFTLGHFTGTCAFISIKINTSIHSHYNKTLFDRASTSKVVNLAAVISVQITSHLPFIHKTPV